MQRFNAHKNASNEIFKKTLMYESRILPFSKRPEGLEVPAQRVLSSLHKNYIIITASIVTVVKVKHLEHLHFWT